MGGDTNLLTSIARIAELSFELSMAKFPFLKKYFKDVNDPQKEWVLWVTAAGAGYVLLTKESYPGEHDEIINSIESIEGLPKIVAEFVNSMNKIIKTKKELYPFGIGMWILTSIKKVKPTVKELKTFSQTIVELLNLTIENYEEEKQKH
jgi:hypothetical protein